VTGRRGRKRRKLLDDLKERRGYSNMKEEELDRTMWRARFGIGFGPVVRQTYLLTPWSRVLLEKLTGLQLIKKFPAFYGTRRFLTALTSFRHVFIS
jgi:hypothetical protein